ncbi:MAG: NAD(P)-dependent oxidoreductase [Deltaproteobacteria bacterium]|nr:MAG: NAD(P)-dependent oxidoreductase [Deltaproteobacteria bacterium]
MSEQQTGPFLVTGASGQLGRLVLDQLLEAGAAPVIATTRTPDKLSDYAGRGVDVRKADFNDPSTLPTAFAGAKRVLIISTDDFAPGKRLETHQAAISAAVKAGVEHIVYTSLTNPSPESPISFAGDHRDTEAELAKCGIQHSILRNNLYADNLLMAGPQAVSMGKLFAAAADGTAGYVTRQDCARAASAALLEAKETATFDITGPELVGQAEIARLLSSVTGKEVGYIPISTKDLAAAMVQNGLPEPIATVLATIDEAIAAGTLSVVSSAVEDLTGVQPTTMADFIASHAAAFGGAAG